MAGIFGIALRGYGMLKKGKKAYDTIKSVKPDVGKLKKIQDGKKKITDTIDKYATTAGKDNPKLLKKFREGAKKGLDKISKIYKDK